MAFNYNRLLLKILLVLSLLSPFVFLSSSLLPWQSNPIGMLTQELIYPIEYLWNGAFDFVGDVWESYFALSRAAKENAQLKSQINLLATKILDYEEQQHEISRLRKLVGFAQRYRRKRSVAEVIGRPRKDPFYTIRISKGSLDEIKIGMPVVAGGGVLGRIVRVGSSFSDVHLLTDSNFYLDVLLQRTRVRGVLTGKFGSHCILKLNRRAEIRIGDTIITSGIIGSFPKGLPVGKVIKISYESDNISQIIVVEPWIDHGRLEEVIILQEHNREMQKILETVDKNWVKRMLDNASGG